MTKTPAQLDAEIGLTTSSRYKPREALVRAAHAAAAMVFVGKPKITAEMVTKAKNLAFRAIQVHDPLAGTKDHPTAAYSYGIVELANEGVKEAQTAWARIKAHGIRR